MENLLQIIFEVFRIKTSDTFGNSHGLNRDDQTFASCEDARKYVISMNRMLCSYDLGILSTNMKV